MTLCPARRLGAVRDTELAIRVRKVELHGTLAQDELQSDFLVGEPAGRTIWASILSGQVNPLNAPDPPTTAEPASLAILGAGLLGIGFVLRRKLTSSNQGLLKFFALNLLVKRARNWGHNGAKTLFACSDS